MSKFDDAYLDLCEKILKEGKIHHNRTGDDTLRILGYTFEFDLGDEFPILTTKQVGIKGPAMQNIRTKSSAMLPKIILIWNGLAGPSESLALTFLFTLAI